MDTDIRAFVEILGDEHPAPSPDLSAAIAAVQRLQRRGHLVFWFDGDAE